MNNRLKPLTDFLVGLGIEQVGHTHKSYLAHLIGDRPHLHRVGSDDPELHWESDRRTEHEAVNPRARLHDS